ncbi:signaling mucin MSB2-like [Hyalella azteca]|uniref:Signaling mucin MSB2-like n=1 Tax=Hyalella azteca TaxID=294128 RepID=A0A979FPI4_HYAAZ|nr:signaling mucin MSB2-like [Hyalella azteca]
MPCESTTVESSTADSAHVSVSPTVESSTADVAHAGESTTVESSSADVAHASESTTVESSTSDVAHASESTTVESSTADVAHASESTTVESSTADVAHASESTTVESFDATALASESTTVESSTAVDAFASQLLQPPAIHPSIKSESIDSLRNSSLFIPENTGVIEEFINENSSSNFEISRPSMLNLSNSESTIKAVNSDVTIDAPEFPPSGIPIDSSNVEINEYYRLTTSESVSLTTEKAPIVAEPLSLNLFSDTNEDFDETPDVSNGKFSTQKPQSQSLLKNLLTAALILPFQSVSRTRNDQVPETSNNKSRDVLFVRRFLVTQDESSEFDQTRDTESSELTSVQSSQAAAAHSSQSRQFSAFDPSRKPEGIMDSFQRRSLFVSPTIVPSTTGMTDEIGNKNDSATFEMARLSLINSSFPDSTSKDGTSDITVNAEESIPSGLPTDSSNVDVEYYYRLPTPESVIPLTTEEAPQLAVPISLDLFSDTNAVFDATPDVSNAIAPAPPSQSVLGNMLGAASLLPLMSVPHAGTDQVPETGTNKSHDVLFARRFLVTQDDSSQFYKRNDTEIGTKRTEVFNPTNSTRQQTEPKSMAEFRSSLDEPFYLSDCSVAAPYLSDERVRGAIHQS